MAEIQNIVASIKLDSSGFDAQIKESFDNLSAVERQAIKNFEATNSKAKAAKEEIAKLIEREKELAKARIGANDPRLIQKIDNELREVQLTLRGLNATPLFDDSSIRDALTKLDLAQSKVLEFRKALSKTNNADERVKISIDLKEAINEVNTLKTQIKGIEIGNLSDSIKGGIAEFSRLNEETKQYVINLLKAEEATAGLADEISDNLSASANRAGKNVKDIGEAAEDAQKPFKTLSSVADTLQKTIIGAIAVNAFQQFTDNLNELVTGFIKLNSQVELLFDRAGQGAVEVTSRIQALSEVTGEGQEEILRAGNAFAKGFSLPIEEALNLIEQGFAQGANVSGEFLDILREYPEDFKRAGLSAQDFIKLTSLQSVRGVFSDRLSDSVRELDIRFNEARSGSGQLLNAVKLLGTGFEKTFKEKLKDPSFEAIDALDLLFAEAKKQGKDIEKGEFLPLIFGTGGEESKTAIKLIKDFRDETLKINEGFKLQLEATKTAKQAQNELASSIAPLLTQFKLLATAGEAFIFRFAREFIDFAKSSPEFLTAIAAGIALNTVNVTALTQKTAALLAAQTGQLTLTGLLTQAQQRLNLAFRTNPIGIVVTAVGFLAAGLKKLYDSNETFRNSVDKLFSVIQKQSAPVIRILQNFIAQFANFSERSKLLTQVVSILSNILNGILVPLKLLLAISIPIIEAFLDISLAIQNAIRSTEAYKAVSAALLAFFTELADVSSKIAPGLSGALNVIKVFIEEVAKLYTSGAEIIKAGFDGLFKGDSFGISRAKALLNQLPGEFKSAGENIASAFDEGFEDYLKNNPLGNSLTIDSQKADEKGKLAGDKILAGAQAQIAANPLELVAKVVLAGGEESAAGLRKQFESERAELIKSEDFKRLIRERKNREAQAVLFAQEKKFFEQIRELSLSQQQAINDAKITSINQAESEAQVDLLKLRANQEISEFQFSQRSVATTQKFAKQRLEIELDNLRNLDKINNETTNAEISAARNAFKNESDLKIQLEQIEKASSERRLQLTNAFNEKALQLTSNAVQRQIDEAQRLSDLRIDVEELSFEERQKFLTETEARENQRRQNTIKFLNQRIKGEETKAGRERLQALQDNYNNQLDAIANGELEGAQAIRKANLEVNDFIAELADKREQAIVESYERELKEIETRQARQIEQAQGNADIIAKITKANAQARVNAENEAAAQLEAIRNKDIQGENIRVNLQGEILQRLFGLLEDIGKKGELTAEQINERTKESLEVTKELIVNLAQTGNELFSQLIENQDAAFRDKIDSQIEQLNQVLQERQTQLDELNEIEEEARGEDKRRIGERKRDIQAAADIEKKQIDELEKKRENAEKNAATRKKVLALIEVAISTAVGVAEATARYSAIPVVGPAALATIIPLIIATGAAQAALIAAQPLAKGTLSVSGGTEGKDSVPALLMPGEAVIPTKQARKHREILQSIMMDKFKIPESFNVSKDLDFSGNSSTPNVISMDTAELVAIREAIMERNGIKVNLDRSGFTAAIANDIVETEILNSKYSTK